MLSFNENIDFQSNQSDGLKTGEKPLEMSPSTTGLARRESGSERDKQCHTQYVQSTRFVHENSTIVVREREKERRRRKSSCRRRIFIEYFSLQFCFRVYRPLKWRICSQGHAKLCWGFQIVNLSMLSHFSSAISQSQTPT